MELLLQKDLSSVRVPRGGDKVYKDECVYSFDTAVSGSRDVRERILFPPSLPPSLLGE